MGPAFLSAKARSSHVADQRVTEFRALHFLGAFHQSREVVGDGLLAASDR